MSLIVCNESCKHQQEGYCTLNQITRLTGEVNAKCGYFETIDKAAPKKEPPTGFDEDPGGSFI